MAISEDTKLYNFIVNVLKGERLLKKAVINYKFKLGDERTVNPDFLAYLVNGDDPFCYLLMELKQRTVSDIPRINEQYQKYVMSDQTRFNPYYIPVPEATISIFINYIFFKTPPRIISEIIYNINFHDDVGILRKKYLAGGNKVISIIKNPNTEENQNLCSIFDQKSQEAVYWDTIVIPFTAADISGIQGTGGSPLNVKINPQVSFTIILSHLCAFIQQRKIQEKPGSFTTDEFFDYIFSAVKGLVVFDDEEKSSIISKLTLFLNHVIMACQEEEFTFIEKAPGRINKFLIAIRKTDNLPIRIASLEAVLFKRIKYLQGLKKLDEFL